MYLWLIATEHWQIFSAPWYVSNMVICRGLQTPTVKEEIRHYSSQYSARLSEHPNNLTTGYCEDMRQTICLPDSKCNCLICSLVFNIDFVGPFPASYNRISTYQLQRSTTEHSSTCKSHSHKPQQAWYLSVTEEHYWALVYI
jgi:hypothetical protein